MSAPVGMEVARAAILLSMPELTVSRSRPKSPPARFVLVSRIGGGSDFAVARPRLLVECYARTGAIPDESAAEQLAQDVDEVLARCHRAGGFWINSWISDKNIASFPDPNTSHARAQFTGELSIAVQ